MREKDKREKERRERKRKERIVTQGRCECEEAAKKDRENESGQKMSRIRKKEENKGKQQHRRKRHGRDIHGYSSQALSTWL